MNRLIPVIGLFVFCSNLHAVELAGGEPAQVAIVPYFTVEGGYDTLMEIRNESFTDIKAFKVVFHESLNGRVTLSFNGYLPPLAQHAIAISRLGGSESFGVVLKGDSNCTVPDFNFGSVQTVGGFSGQNLLPIGYINEAADGGPTDSSRANEGYLVAYEMGAVDPDHPLGQAILPAGGSGVPFDCAALTSAFIPQSEGGSGIWVDDINEGLFRPSTGTLSIKTSVVNVLGGTLRQIPTTTIRDFTVELLHRSPGDPLFLSAVNPAISKVLLPGGTILQSRWDNAIDAISAVLMIERARVNYNTEAAIGAESDFVVTLPTKGFYTDPAIVGSTAQVPFTRTYLDANGCETAFTQRLGRQGESESGGNGELCGVANVYAAQPFSTLGSLRAQVLAGVIDKGSFLTMFDRDSNSSVMKGENILRSIEGHEYCGLPAIAFSAVEYTNGTLVDFSGSAVLSNYGQSDDMVSERMVRLSGKTVKY